jgi:hypothetical protein
VRRTFERRQTILPVDIPIGLSDEFTVAWVAQWQTFLGRERMAAAPAELAAVIADLRAFLIPLAGAADVDWIWPPRGPWSQPECSPDADENKKRMNTPP